MAQTRCRCRARQTRPQWTLTATAFLQAGGTVQQLAAEANLSPEDMFLLALDAPRTTSRRKRRPAAVERSGEE
eukprot:11200873-Lingulodinium_polyedra.AAC.1